MIEVYKLVENFTIGVAFFVVCIVSAVKLGRYMLDAFFNKQDGMFRIFFNKHIETIDNVNVNVNSQTEMIREMQRSMDEYFRNNLPTQKPLPYQHYVSPDSEQHIQSPDG